jgi:hypothetical protein
MMSAALSIVMLLYLWGSCIAYLVIIGDSFSPLLKMALGDSHPLVKKLYKHLFSLWWHLVDDVSHHTARPAALFVARCLTPV